MFSSFSLPCIQQTTATHSLTSIERGEKSQRATALALAVSGLVLAGLSVLQLAIITPLTFAVGTITVAALAITALLCCVVACMLCRRPTKAPEKPVEIFVPKKPEAPVEVSVPKIVEQPKEEEEARRVSIEKGPITPAPRVQTPEIKKEEPSTKYIRPSLKFIYPFVGGLFKTRKGVAITPDAGSIVIAKFGRALRGLSSLIDRMIKGKDIVTITELGALFFAKIHRLKTSPLSNLIFDGYDVMTQPHAGTAWLCHALADPSAFHDLGAYLTTLVRFFTSSQASSRTPSAGLLALGTLTNSFLCGWIFPSELNVITVLQAIDRLPLDPDAKKSLVIQLEVGNVLGCITLAYKHQNLPWNVTSNAFFSDHCTLWSPDIYTEDHTPTTNKECLSKVEVAFQVLSRTCPGSLISFLSLGNDFSELETAIDRVFNDHPDFTSSASGILSLTITSLVAIHKDPSLQMKLKSILPSESIVSVEKFTSCLLAGSLATGMMNDHHLELLASALGCSSEVAKTMITERVVASILMGNML